MGMHAHLLPKKGSAMIAASPAQDAASPAFLQPGSPASEATSEWSAHSSASAQASEKGTKPFGKQCPDLKKPTIFHIFSYLDNDDLTETSFVSKQCHNLAMNEANWHLAPPAPPPAQ